MKFTIEQSTLRDLLAHVKSVVDKRHVIPVLSNVMLRAEGHLLHVTATNMDQEIIEFVDAEVSEPGVTTAPVHVLSDIASNLPDGALVDIELAGTTLKVKSGRSRFRLNTLPFQDFPVMVPDPEAQEFEVGAADLKRLLDLTKPFVSQDVARYTITGVYLHAVGDEIRAVATDGNRMALVNMPLPPGAAFPGVILPEKAVAEMCKIMDGADTVRVSLSPTKVCITAGSITFTSKLVDGDYPNYARIVPTTDKSMTASAADLTAMIKRVAAVEDASSCIDLELADGRLTMTSLSTTGDAAEEIDVAYSGANLGLSVNSRYLLEVLAQLPDAVMIAFKDTVMPIALTDPADASVLYLTMPMRGNKSKPGAA